MQDLPVFIWLAHHSHSAAGLRKATFHSVTPKSPSSAKVSILSYSYQNVETIVKRHCLSNQQFSELRSQDVVAQLPGKMAKPPWSWRMLLPESIVSSWKSSWAPLGQVTVPVAFLEHSRLQTLIPLTHISNREGCSPETRKTSPSNPGSIPVVLQCSLFTKKPLWRCLSSEATNSDFFLFP